MPAISLFVTPIMFGNNAVYFGVCQSDAPPPTHTHTQYLYIMRRIFEILTGIIEDGCLSEQNFELPGRNLLTFGVTCNVDLQYIIYPESRNIRISRNVSKHLAISEDGGFSCSL